MYRKKYWLVFLFCFSLLSNAETEIIIKDIDNFCNTYRLLSKCSNNKDSINCIEENYIKCGSRQLKKFIRVYNYKATYFLSSIKAYPKFWESIEKNLLDIKNIKSEIQVIIDTLSKILPGLKNAKIAFLVGCINTGGTVLGNTVYIGSEVATADFTTNSNGLSASLRRTMRRENSLIAYVAHELVHTQQTGFPITEFFKLAKHRKLSLQNICITEGSADFITNYFLNLNINSSVHEFALGKEDELFRAFWNDSKTSPFDYNKWIYNNGRADVTQADLGYYIGYKLSEKYYLSSGNKQKAIKTLLKRGAYKKVIKFYILNENKAI